RQASGKGSQSSRPQAAAHWANRVLAGSPSGEITPPAPGAGDCPAPTALAPAAPDQWTAAPAAAPSAPALPPPSDPARRPRRPPAPPPSDASCQSLHFIPPRPLLGADVYQAPEHPGLHQLPVEGAAGQVLPVPAVGGGQQGGSAPRRPHQGPDVLRGGDLVRRQNLGVHG